MLKNKTITCFVPAKATSQRVAGKNLRLCCGIPLIRYPAHIAFKSGIFDTIVVSTESDVMEFEFATPIEQDDLCWRHDRPKKLCKSTSNVWDAVKHYCSITPIKTDYICLLHATSPCIRPGTVKWLARRLLHSSNDTACVSSSIAPDYIFPGSKIPDYSNETGTQFKIKKYCLNNAFIMAQWDTVIQNKIFEKCMHVPIPKDEAIDIDDETDLMIAESIIQWRLKHEKDTEPTPRDIRSVHLGYDASKIRESARKATIDRRRADKSMQLQVRHVSNWSGNCKTQDR